MKKFLAVYVGLALMLLIGVNVVDATNIFGMTDEEIMNKYIEERYGDRYYGVLDEDLCDENEIGFDVYQKEYYRYTVWIDKDYFENRYDD